MLLKIVVLGILMVGWHVSDVQADIKKNGLSKPGLITLDFKKISVKELLEFIAEETNFNIIFNESVAGSIALHLKQVSWQEAFDAVLEISGLAKQVQKNLIYVATPTDFVRRHQVVQQAALIKPVKIKLHHVDAKLAAEQINTEQLLTAAGKIACNAQDNSLWVRESSDNLSMVIDYLRKLDVPVPQILIAARIINLDDKQKCELGIKFTSGAPDKSSSNSDRNSSESCSANFRFAILNLVQNQMINVELDALEKSGHSHTIADPTIVAQNRKTATIEAGEDIPYQEKTSSGATSVSFKKAALSLRVTPTILPDSRIILDLEVNQNKILPLSVNGTPIIQTQELKTQVVVHANEGVILGGIYETEHAKVSAGIPLLDQVPGVSSLVTHHQNEQLKKELFILISPHIL